MSSLREQRLAQFRSDILAGKRDSNNNLFRILYGLSPEIQIELARDMTARFLPIYREHHPDVAWPGTILDGVEEYFNATGEGLPEEPEETFGGDAELYNCLYGLSDAWSYSKKNDFAKVTSACCTTLIWAVAARAANVWHADDPEAARALQVGDQDTWQGRAPRFNVASRAVVKREWLIVADWLEERDVGSYPDTEDSECEKALARWQDREYLL